MRIEVQPGEDPRRAWFRHEVAALSEGCCPRTGERLEPVDTPRGPGGGCRHGLWWHGPTPGAFEGDYSVAWWALPGT